jgi:hypothetical protein
VLGIFLVLVFSLLRLSTVGRLLKKNDRIVVLNLAWNGCGHIEIAKSIVDGKIKISEYQPGAEELGHAIQKNDSLQRLDLSHNRIQTMGAFVIANGMSTNQSLLHLSMDGNPVGMAGGRELLRAMRKLGDIREISLRDCNIKHSDQKLVDFDPTKPANDGKMYQFDISKPYDQAVVSQLIRIVGDSGGRDRWREVTRSTADQSAKDRKTEKLDKAGHWSPPPWSTSPDELCVAAIACDVVNKFMASWDQSEPQFTLLSFYHDHIHREPTNDDVVSSSALQKLKTLIRETKKGSATTDKALEEQEKNNTVKVSNSGKYKVLAAVARLMRDKLNEGDQQHSVMSIAMEGMAKKKREENMAAAAELAEKRAAEAKERAEKADVLREKIAAQLASSTTEDQKKQQKDILNMTAKEFYFKAEQVDQLLDLFDDKMDKADAVVKLFERVLDTDALLEIVEERMDLEQRLLIERQLGPLYRLDPKNPTGHYKIDLSKNFERLVAMKLLALSTGENEEREQEGLIDTSQGAGGPKGRYNFRNQTMDGKPLNKKFASELPNEGLFEFDFTSTFLNGDPRPHARGPLMKPPVFRRFLDNMRTEFSAVAGGKPVLEKERERIVNKVRMEMKQGRFVTSKQVCAIMHTAKLIPMYCYCTYCWNVVDKRKNGEMNLANHIFLPCQHMVCCEECAKGIQRNFAHCAFCALRVEEVCTWDTRKKWVKKYGEKVLKGADYGAKRVKREFSKFDLDGSGSLDRSEVARLITKMLGKNTTDEDIVNALEAMDEDGSGEVEYSEFAAWWQREHSDEHPAGADMFNVKKRIDEEMSRGALASYDDPSPRYAGDRELGKELAILLFGRTVDLLQFKKVMHFFSNEERMDIYHRLGPLNALNPMDPDGRWQLALPTLDDNAVAHMLVLLAVGEPGENWLDETYGLSEDKMRSFDLPAPWLTEVPKRGFLDLVYFTSAQYVDMELRESLVSKVRFVSS